MSRVCQSVRCVLAQSLVWLAALFCSVSFATPLPWGVLADSSYAWEADGVHPDGTWQHGYYQSGLNADSFAPSPVWTSYFGGPESWIGGQGEVWNTNGYPQLGKYAMAPGRNVAAVRRWTSNFVGTVTLQVDCQQIQESRNDQAFLLYRNGVLETRFQKASTAQHLIFVETCEVAFGDVLDFVIDPLGNHQADWTHVVVRILNEASVTDALFHYPFNETNDLPIGRDGAGSPYDRRSRVGDFSGKDHHAVLQNMDRDLSPVVGVHDFARSFDGVDDHLLLEKREIGKGAEELTLSVWINPLTLAPGTTFLSSSGDSFSLAVAADGQLTFTARGAALKLPELTLPLGEWSHLAATWQTGQFQRLYLNGERLAQAANVPSGTADPDQWLLACDPAGSGCFHGALDEVSLLPYALNDEKVRNLFRERAIFESPSGQVARFHDGVSDCSGDSNIGDGGTELTLAAWVAPFKQINNAAMISSLGDDFFGLIQNRFGLGNPIQFRVKSVALTGPDFSLPTGQWNHVVGVWKSGEIQKLYLNGSEVGSHPNPPSGPISIDRWIIGCDRLTRNRYFNGFIEDVTILPRALTPEEVLALSVENLPEGTAGPFPLPGHLRWDYVFNIQHRTIESLVDDPAFHAPNRNERGGFLPAAGTGAVPTNRSASRLRGYLTAPETGEYFFWISGRQAVDLFLSPDDQKYTKQRIARLSPEDGTGTGTDLNWPDIWDVFPSQMSEPVLLEAGQRYFIEALQTHGLMLGQSHASIAWARPDGDREPIPAEFLTPYVLQPADRDDDYLPDLWETEHGLDSEDNGATDTDRQGEYGDYDADGLTNREEYLSGTDPANPDSDGDGLSDLAEQTVHGTDPAISNLATETMISSLDLNSVTTTGVSWVDTGVGLLSSSFRNSGRWDFELPADGHYILQIDGTLGGDLRFEDRLPVVLSIDGIEVTRQRILFRNRQPGSLRYLTPWLCAGTHQLDLFIDNETVRRTLTLTAIKVIAPGGTVTQADGVPDQVRQHLENRSFVLPHSTVTHVSPAFVEGRSPASDLVSLTLLDRSGQRNRLRRFNERQWNRMLPRFERRLGRFERRLRRATRRGWGRMEGRPADHLPGPGRTTWFARLDLNPNEATGYVAQLECSGISEHAALVWQPRNVLDGGEMTVPLGSEVLLGAWIRDWDWQKVTLQVADEPPVTFRSSLSHRHLCNSPGTFQVTASHPEGASGTLTIHVRAAALPSDLVVGELRTRSVDFPEVEPDLAVDADRTIAIRAFQAATTGGSTALASGLEPGVYWAAARLGPQKEILDLQEVTVVGVSDALRHASDLQAGVGDNMVQVTSHLLVTHLPEDATVQVTVFAGGVTLLDGSTTITLTRSDFDAFGYRTLDFLVPRERAGAPCHYVRIFDGAGTKIWGSTR